MALLCQGQGSFFLPGYPPTCTRCSSDGKGIRGSPKKHGMGAGAACGPALMAWGLEGCVHETVMDQVGCRAIGWPCGYKEVRN